MLQHFLSTCPLLKQVYAYAGAQARTRTRVMRARAQDFEKKWTGGQESTQVIAINDVTNRHMKWTGSGQVRDVDRKWIGIAAKMVQTFQTSS